MLSSRRSAFIAFGLAGAFVVAPAGHAAPVTSQPMPAPIEASEPAAPPKPLPKKPIPPKAATRPAKPAKPPKRSAASAPKLGTMTLRSSEPSDPMTTGAVPERPVVVRPPPVQPGNPVIRVNPASDEDQRTDMPTDQEETPAQDPADRILSDPLPTRQPADSLAPPAATTSPARPPAVPARPAAGPNGPVPGPGTTPATRSPAAPGATRPPTPTNAPQGRVVAQTPSGLASATPTLARAAVSPNPRSPDEDPLTDRAGQAYDQIGVRTGAFTWRPAIESSVGVTSNVQGTPKGASSSAYRIAPELLGESDWSRHQLKVDLHGSLTEYPAQTSLYRPTITGTVTGRVDISEGVTLDLRSGYSQDRLPASSTANAAGTTVPGLTETLTGSVGVTRDMGLIALTLRGDFDRTLYQQGTTTTSSAVGPSALDNSHYVAAFRASYSNGADLRPFVEVQATDRDYNAAPAHAANVADPPNRDSLGYAVKTGATLRFGPVLSGEVAVGYGTEKPADSRLAAVRALTTDASLVWAPTRLTTVTLTATTAFEPTLLTGSSGAVTRTTGVKLTEALMRNLSAELGASVLVRTYTGISRTENLTTATSGLVWKLNPYVQTFVRGSFDTFASSAHTDGYKAYTVFAGVRLQR